MKYVVIDSHDLADWDSPERLDLTPVIGPFNTYGEAALAAIYRWKDRYSDEYIVSRHDNEHNDRPVTGHINAHPIADDREMWILPMSTPDK